MSVSQRMTISGVGGLLRDANIAQVTLQLLGLEDLSLTLPVAFAPRIDATTGNLLGRDVLEYFDFGLSHGNRTGYIGRRQ